MFNLFTYRRSKQVQADQKKIQEAQALVQRRRKDALGGSRIRASSNNLASLTQESTGMKGLKTPEKGVYLRRYVPAVMRAEQNAKDFLSGHLACEEPYNPLSPHNYYPGRFSEFYCHAEERPKPSDQLAALRVGHSVSHSRILAYDQSTLGSAFLPKFRTREKGKEGGRKDFLPYNKEFKQETAWQTPQVYTLEPYIDGLEALGNRWKDRDKSKELSPKGFRPSHSGDVLLGRGSIGTLDSSVEAGRDSVQPSL